MNRQSRPMSTRMPAVPFRGAAILALLLCAAAPARAQDPAPPVPRCVAAPDADTTLVRYDCAGTGQWAQVRYSVSLPAGWDVQEMEERNVTLAARRGTSGVFVQGSDQLFVPVTARDSSDFWIFAGDLLLDRVPTAGEVAGLIRDAGDESGMRAMVTRTQSTDSALASLADMLASRNEQIEVIGQLREVSTLGGLRAGTLHEVRRVNGQTLRSEGRVTVSNAVFYGLIVMASDEEYQAHQPLWDRVFASFVIHPSTP